MIPCSPLKMSTEAAPAPQKIVDFDLAANNDEKIATPEDATLESNPLKKMISVLGISSADDAALPEDLPVFLVDGWKKFLELCEIGLEKMWQLKKYYYDERGSNQSAGKRKWKKSGGSGEDMMNFLLISLFGFVAVLSVLSVLAACV